MPERLPFISVVLIYAVRLAELGTKRATVRGSILEKGTLRLFILAGGLMLALGWLEQSWRQPGWSGMAFGAGWLAAVASFALRWRAIAALGRFWSLHVEIREGHELVTSGPFRWIRHPTYLSMILELLAAACLLQAPLALLAAGLLFVPVMARRIRLEESALVAKFGAAYREYQRTTPALIPYRRPRQ